MESQPLGRPVQQYRIVDAATGLVEEGEVDVADMVARQPWDGDLPFRVKEQAERVPAMTTTIPDSAFIRPGEAGYDDARRVWNAMVDRRPALIVALPRDERRRGRRRAGPARGSRDRRPMRRAQRRRPRGAGGRPDDRPDADGRGPVDPERRRAWVQGGALLGALDAATQPHGLATTAGNVSHTGVGGLTLGGGMGWLARQHGLACDNVVSFEVVTAAGEVVRASAEENPELFWGLRGGGGNFGIVTEFEFRLHDTGTRALSVELDFPRRGRGVGGGALAGPEPDRPAPGDVRRDRDRRRRDPRLRLGRRSGARAASTPEPSRRSASR